MFLDGVKDEEKLSKPTKFSCLIVGKSFFFFPEQKQPKNNQNKNKRKIPPMLVNYKMYILCRGWNSRKPWEGEKKKKKIQKR